MSDLETPWVTPESPLGEEHWFDEGPFTGGGAAFAEQPWAAPETGVVEARSGEHRPESPFETPVAGFEATDEWQASGAVAVAEGEAVPGCGGPVSGTPPLVYRGSTAVRSRNPWVGRAQSLLNAFLAQHRAGTESCTDTGPPTRQYIAAKRASLAPIGQDPLVVDCVFGQGTETATLMFQACRGLLRDGKIGERTWPQLLTLSSTPVPTPTPTPTPPPTPTPTPPSTTPAVRVRQDVWTLSATATWHPTILWYARGVASLRARPLVDPRSWMHLANTHGTSSPSASWPGGALWEQCEHFSWHFLSWHRAYVHHFERIMREEVIRLGGPSDWALPYWNYSDGTRPEVLRLPPAFRAPAMPGSSTNPLMVPQRAPAINRGGPLSTREVSTAAMDRETDFTPAVAGTTGFGGARALERTHQTTLRDGGALENSPHGMVHMGVGGRAPDPPGLMSGFDTAAQDPIFWLHPANIDRLWQAWLRRPGVAGNPQETAWSKPEWVFGSGSTVTRITTRQLLDPTAAPLGYRYSDMPTAPTPEAEEEWFDERSQRDDGLENRPLELVGASEEEIPLGPTATTTRVALGQPAGPSRQRLEEAEAVPPGVKVYLRLDNITGTVVHTSGVVVYVNVPPGGRPGDFPDREAGAISMFGVVETSRRDSRHAGTGLGATFDITRVARSLASAGQWDRTKVDVTFVPIPDALGRVGTGDVKVGRVSVFYA